jgi:hypothetical protein
MNKIPRDKMLHFFVSALSTFLLSIASPIMGVSFTVGLGLGKEYGDSKAKGNRWDWFDIIADLVGISLGLLLALLIRRVIWIIF